MNPPPPAPAGAAALTSKTFWGSVMQGLLVSLPGAILVIASVVVFVEWQAALASRAIVSVIVLVVGLVWLGYVGRRRYPKPPS